MASTGVGGGGGVGKLIIKSGTKLSLHERFSQLAHVVDETPPPPPPAAPVVTAVSSHHQHHHHHPAVHRIPPSSSVLRSSQSFYDPPPVYSRYDSTGGSHPQAGSSSFLSRTPPSAQTSYSSSSYNYDHHPLQRNSLDYETALEYKRNSLMNRLGRRPTTNPQYGHYGPYYRPQVGYRPRNRVTNRFNYYGGGGSRRGGMYNNRRSGRSQSYSGGPRRWASTTSLASDGTQAKRYRSNSYSYANRFNRGRRGRGGSGRFRNNRGGNRSHQQEKISREELDKQLDQYMANTRSALDKEMDQYMQEK